MKTNSIYYLSLIAPISIWSEAEPVYDKNKRLELLEKQLNIGIEALGLELNQINFAKISLSGQMIQVFIDESKLDEYKEILKPLEFQIWKPELMNFNPESNMSENKKLILEEIKRIDIVFESKKLRRLSGGIWDSGKDLGKL